MKFKRCKYLIVIGLLTNCVSEAGINISPPGRKFTGSVELTRDLAFSIDGPATTASLLVLEGFNPGGLPTVYSFRSLNFSQEEAPPEIVRGIFADANTVWGGDISSSDTVVRFVQFVLNSDPEEVVDTQIFLQPGDDSGLSRSITLNAFFGGFNSTDGSFTASETFTGNAYLADSNGNRISDLVPVPEPKTYAALMGALALFIAGLRRRQK